MSQKNVNCVIAVDCMGGDSGCAVTVPAALNFLRTNNEVALLLCGDTKIIKKYLGKHANNSNIMLSHSDEYIEMYDSLEVALRKKKNSSLHLALHAVKEGRADVCVSAGNTAALVAVSRYILKTMACVERPALCALLPNIEGRPTYMLDLGANVGCTELHLSQFAFMGSVFAAVSEGIEPRVGLVNVGSEEGKGDQVVRNTYQMLQEADASQNISFAGFVEGNDIFSGKVDVIVCDGFVGNVALKAVEGLTHLVKHVLGKSFRHNLWTKLSALFAYKTMKIAKEEINNSRYNGACLLGLRGLVYKSHGGADIDGFSAALGRAYDAVERGMLNKLEDRMKATFSQTSPDLFKDIK